MMLNKNRWQQYLLNFSPWILATACLLLIILLGMFAVSNYQREKQLLVEGIAQKGLALIRFINSSVQNSIRDDLLSERFEPTRWKTHISDALTQAIEQPGVDYIVLLDGGDAEIISSAGEIDPPGSVNEAVAAFRALGFQESSFDVWKSRIITDNASSKKKFQLALHYRPLEKIGRRAKGPNRGKGGRMMQRFSHHSEFSRYENEFFQLVRQRPYFVIQLDFEEFSSPLDRQLIQIVILSLITILVGIGGMLSFATLRGLRGSQLRIGKMQAFTDILVSSLPVGLIATDASGKIQICNDAVQELLELSEKEITGKMPFDCLHKKVASAFLGNSVDSPKKKLDKEIEIINHAGKKKSLHLASKVVFGKDGSFAGEVLLVRDLTELKYLEKELQRSERMAALGKMAAGVAHELRNPLSSIKGLSVLLKSMVADNEKGTDTAEILVKEVERLNRSIGELLDYAKPANLQKEFTSLVDILEKTKSLIEIDANIYGVEIIIDCQEDLPSLELDKDKINQLFLNLFLNSLQAMPDGGRLEVVASVENDSVCVDVRDNGTGIEPEHLSRVLDPYFTTKSDGTGLGLSMSSKIVEEHGGQLFISSTFGEFTNIRLTLPMSR